MATILEYLAMHAHQILWGLGIFVISLIASSLVVMVVILRLPEFHFHTQDVPPASRGRAPWQRWLKTIAKNVVGLALVVLGLVMALPGVPGQGLLTMFMGIVLLDVPGKRALERRIVSIPSVFRGCNRLRARYGKPPFTLDE